MERLEVEIPVSVGDKVYRTNNTCDVLVGEIIRVEVDSEYYKSDSQVINKSDITFTVKYGYGYNNEVKYGPNDLGTKVFSTKKDLIKHIVGEI